MAAFTPTPIHASLCQDHPHEVHPSPFATWLRCTHAPDSPERATPWSRDKLVSARLGISLFAPAAARSISTTSCTVISVPWAHPKKAAGGFAFGCPSGSRPGGGVGGSPWENDLSPGSSNCYHGCLKGDKHITPMSQCMQSRKP